MVEQGDCLKVMAGMEASSVDAIVTDPPYGLSFMGKEWDRGVPGVPFWTEALRVARPGSYLLAMGGTRTYHRLTCAIEDAGWEIRDCLCWLYGQGFPKGKACLKPAWEPIVMARKRGKVRPLRINDSRLPARQQQQGRYQREGSTPICAARDNRLAVYPANLGRWPANVCLDEEAAAMLDEQSGECGGSNPITRRPGFRRFNGTDYSGGKEYHTPAFESSGYADSGGASRFFYVAKASRGEREAGLDCQEIVMLEWRSWEGVDQKVRLRVDTAQSPPRVIAVSGASSSNAIEWSMFLFGSPTTDPFLLGFRFTTATATRSTTDSPTLKSLVHWLTSAGTRVVIGAEENGGSRAASAGHSALSLTITDDSRASLPGAVSAASGTQLRISVGATPADHPTVKPIALMRWLCRLVTPPGGTVLDQFAGSGTTGCAAALEGLRFVGIEKEAEYVAIANARIKHWGEQGVLPNG